MQLASAALALAIPVLLGGAWLNTAVPQQTPARPFIVWGCGTVLGLIAIPQLMRVLFALGWSLEFFPIAACALLLTLPAALLHFALRDRRSAGAPRTPVGLPTNNLERVLIALALALILMRFLTLAAELSVRPLYPWDATMHWATKARVWFEHSAITPFIPAHDWLFSAGQGVHTDRHPNYPLVVPLLQVWMNLGLGGWHESLMNLPWLLCYLALGLAFYGQLRLAGVGTTVATVACYMLLSMPLINTHVALAGYADLFLGAAYGCAVMCLHNWMRSREAWLAVLAVLFALACPLIKNEGVIWALTLIPGAMIAFMQRRQAAKMYVLLALVGILLVLIIPDDLEIAGFTVKSLEPTFDRAALLGIIQSIWLHDSWHLFGYLLLILIPLGIVMAGTLTRTYLGLTVCLGAAASAFLFLFVFTGFAEGAVNFAAVGRLSIQLAPPLAFLCVLLYNEVLQRDNRWRVHGGV